MYDEELAASADPDDLIRDVLEKSDVLIVICSSDSCRSCRVGE
jgi:hypothetical protein